MMFIIVIFIFNIICYPILSISIFGILIDSPHDMSLPRLVVKLIQNINTRCLILQS